MNTALLTSIKRIIHNYVILFYCGIFTFYVLYNEFTGYNQSVTGCGSQRRHVVVTQRKLM